jgi:hypothetical protein
MKAWRLNADRTRFDPVALDIETEPQQADFPLQKAG